MNNAKMDYAKKYHYLLKYFILSFPLIFLLICSFNSKDYLSDNLNYLSHLVYGLVDNNPLVSWYSDMLNLFNISLADNYLIFIQVLPLWIIAVYLFDLLIDVLLLVPRLVHKAVSKIGGDY